MASDSPTKPATSQERAAPVRRPRLRPWLQRLHRLLGLSAGLVAVSMGLSGTILAFRAEIDQALNPALYRVTVQGERRPLDDLAAVAAAELPDGAITRINLPVAPSDVLKVMGRQSREAFVDPYSGRLLGSRDGSRTLVGWTLKWHQEFGAGETGNRIVGWGVLGLILVILSGAWLARPIRRPKARQPATSWKARIFASHRQIGLVTGGFLLVMASTGAAFVYRGDLLAVYSGITGAPAITPEPALPAGTLDGRVSLDQAIVTAQARYPQAQVTTIHPPAKVGKPLRIVLRQPGEPHPSGRTVVYLDPRDGRVLDTMDALTAPAAWQALYAWPYPIHTGEFGGFATRLLVFAMGPLPAILFVTGFLIWRNKRRPARQR